MKLIFMDFDGVINHTNIHDLDDFKRNHICNEKVNYISLQNITPLTELFIFCRLNDIKIVVSSSWYVFGLDKIKSQLSEAFGRNIIDSVFIDTVDYLLSGSVEGVRIRTAEILKWMLNNNYNEKSYLIIDDERELFEEVDIKNKLFHIDSNQGFSFEDFYRIKEYFNLNAYEDHPYPLETIDEITKEKILKSDGFSKRK